MENDQQIRGGFRLFVERGGAVGDLCIAGAIERSQELRSPYIVDICSTGHPEILDDRQCLGVGGLLFDPIALRIVRKNRYPAINFSNRAGPLQGVGNFLSDDDEIGRLGAEHLIARGYRHFLAVAQGEGGRHGGERLEGFRRRVQKQGMTCEMLFHDFRKKDAGFSTVRYVKEIEEALKPHLERLPLDTGIFAANDWVAGLIQRLLMDYFPERLHTTGVLGVDNEQQSWWYLGPLAGLSSVLPAFRRIGREAMEWLIAHPGDKEAAAGLMKRFAPEGVIERASTAGSACADPLTARIVRWAWSQLQSGHPMNVSDLASQHNMSRRSVDRRFQEHVGLPAGEFLQGLKLDLARQLLKTTDLQISEISLHCGFAKQDVLSRAIKAKDGCTPRAFREANRRVT